MPKQTVYPDNDPGVRFEPFEEILDQSGWYHVDKFRKIHELHSLSMSENCINADSKVPRNYQIAQHLVKKIKHGILYNSNESTLRHEIEHIVFARFDIGLVW